MSHFFSINKSFSAISAVCVAMMLVFASCGSSRSGASSSRGRSYKKGGSMAKVEYAVIDGTLDSSSKALLLEAKRWLGTPYKYGGEDKGGVDCSGLVLSVYRNALNIKLPRSSSKQKEFSSSISRKDLIPGDLLFFATTRGSSGVSHVGLYIGEGKMVHSSTSRGVMVSGIDEEYFVKTYAGAGRVDAYYAMLGKAGKKNKPGKTKGKKEQKPRATEPSAEPSFRYEPVAAVPSRVTPAPSPAQPTVTSPDPAPVLAQASAIPDAAGSTISAEDARRMVLNSLIEEKLDSIYSSAQ